MLKSLKFKVVLAGDGGVGKSTLLYHFLEKEELTTMTRGLSIEKLLIPLGEEKSVECVCWDLGGQPQFRFFLEDFLGGTHFALFVYDLNRYASLLSLENEWIPMFQKEVPNLLCPLLVGNKADLGQTIPDDEIERIAAKFFMQSIKVSALQGNNLPNLIAIVKEVVINLSSSQ